MNGRTSKKTSILSLPLAPSLPEFLTPDPAFPSVEALLSLSSYSSEHAKSESKPSLLRRSRQVKAHFCYTTPLPLTFPYAIKPSQIIPRKVNSEAVGDGSAVKEGAPQRAKQEAAADSPEPKVPDIEDYLASLEPDWQDPIRSNGGSEPSAYTSDGRRNAVGTPQLMSVSRKCLEDLLPNLDVGDALDGVTEGADLGDNKTEIRQELTSFLAGHIVRVQKPNEDRKRGFAPWSLCYGGHQFGSWASQLGDGRAVSILTTPSSWPVYHDGTYYPPVAEFQLKGAGRTPFSRFADGLAVLRSSVREYLGSEAMAALGVPTSRALSLVHLPDVRVRREEMETGAIVCRIAPSWLRIGSFELLWSRDDWDNLRDLVNYAGHQVFGFGNERAEKANKPKDLSMAALVLRETSTRNARTFAGWQAAGFMHGVLNTDNISISGLTIDYGPYAWMDIYNANHICNHSDGEGRYSYRNQPTIGIDAIAKMGNALAEIIGCELELAEKSGEDKVAEAATGWAEDQNKHELWRDKAENVIKNITAEFAEVFAQEYRKLMGNRLGLSDLEQSDVTNLIEPMLTLMSQHHLDFSRTFRLLTQFTTTDSPYFDRFVDMICPTASVPQYLQDSCKKEWKDLLANYQIRLEKSESKSGRSREDRRERMKAANPRFILRQWILEDVIARLENDNDLTYLNKVLDMATNPFKDYAEDLVDPAMCFKPSAEQTDDKRLCDVGDERMLGFQCSCSS